jgi:hypothetical protein
MKRLGAVVVVLGLVACGEDDSSGSSGSGGGSGGAGGSSASGGSAGSATGGSSGGGAGGTSAGGTSAGGTGGSAAGAGGTGGSTSTCGAECANVVGNFNTTPVSFQCTGSQATKTFVNVGGPNLLIVCHDSTNTYTFTLSLKGPVGKFSGTAIQDNYFKLEAGAEGLSSQNANVTDWYVDLTTWDLTGKHAAGSFHLVATDDGSSGLAQWTAYGSLDGKFDVTY